MDVSAVLLNKLLKEKSIDVWSKLKLAYLDPEYTSLYAAISRYYTTYSSIPSFDDLEIVVRELPVSNTLAALRLVEDADVSAEVALDALIDQYTQNECVKLLDKFIDKLPIYDTAEIKDNLAALVLALDEKTLSSENVYTVADLMMFHSQEDLNRSRVTLGLNNDFDAATGGLALQELIYIGGIRGSGKSITASNCQVNQFKSGFASCYFTIEMTAAEVFQRNMAILAGVPHDALKKGTLTTQQIDSLVEAKCSMFSNGDSFLEDYHRSRDHFAFEQSISRNGILRPDNQMIIVDDRALTLGAIDLHLGKMKTKFGDAFRLGIIDYVNQVVMEGTNQFDWQPQVMVSKKLKELARKYEIAILSPYQIDATGEARFAKGILDAADIAKIMEAHPKETGCISYKTTKIRGGKELDVTSGINWDTLAISPVSMPRPAAAKAEDSKKGGKKQPAVGKENENDLPF